MRRILSAETMAGMVLPAMVYFAWPKGSSYAAWVFAAAMAWLLLGPWFLKPKIQSDDKAVINHALCRAICLAFALVFLAVCLLGELCGNYLLWLKAAYYIAFSGRLLSLLYSLPKGGSYWLKMGWLSLWAICALTPLLWSNASLGGHSLYLAMLLPLWAIGCTLLLLLLQRRAAMHGLAMALLCLGPLPPMALAWPLWACWILGGLAFLFLLILWWRKNLPTPPPASAAEERGKLWLPLWLFRTVFLAWWCLGCALCLSLAWWPPGHDLYFEYNAWLKAFALGLFVLICIGLLVEYLMPLLGRPEPEGHWRRDASWGPILSALAMMMALTPALLLPYPHSPSPQYQDRVRAVLLDQPMTLDAAQPDITLALPEEITSINRVYIVSRLVHGQNLVQAQPVAVLAVMGESGLPDIYYLRAGIDTAEENLEQSRVLATAMHEAVERASQTKVFSPDGQAYYRQSYLGGLFLQDAPERLRSISLHYMPSMETAATPPAPYLVVEKVMVE